MKSLINFSLRNKFAVWLLTIIIVFAGLYSGLTMKQETLPNISIPYLSITTIYPGAAPEGVVNDVSKPLEQKLRNVDGVKMLTSTSLENASSVTIEFDYGTNLDNATAAVREALNEVKLPDEVQKPQISRFSLSSLPVISLSISDESSGDLEELTRVAENDIRPALEDIEGVASVQIAGQYVKEVSLKFNQEKLKQYGLTEDTIKGIIQASCGCRSGCSRWTSHRRLLSLTATSLQWRTCRMSAFRWFLLVLRRVLPEPVQLACLAQEPGKQAVQLQAVLVLLAAPMLRLAVPGLVLAP